MTFHGDILALDVATQTGWCLGVPGTVPRTGSIRFARKGASLGAHFAGCAEWLTHFVTVAQPRLVVFEAPVPFMTGHTTASTTRLLVGLVAIVEATLYGKDFDVREARVSDVRSFFLGSNRFKREEAKDRTKAKCRQMGWQVSDDNAADAAALWAYQVAIVAPEHGVKLMPLFRKAF